MTKQTTETMPEAVAAPEEMQNATDLPAVTVDELECLDVYAGEEAPQDSGAWRIKDDSAAEWAVRKIAAERAELERIKALLQYLKDSGRTDMIQTVEKAKWGEFKKGLEIVDGTVIDTETGEIVEGVEIQEKPDTFVVEV